MWLASEAEDDKMTKGKSVIIKMQKYKWSEKKDIFFHNLEYK